MPGFILYIASANVLIQGDIAKITDFGLPNMLNQSISISRGEGNTAYIDPAVFKRQTYKQGKRQTFLALE